METSPSLEFEHFLAAKLGMTVAQMRADMSNDEFMRWDAYYARLQQREELGRAKAGGKHG